MRYLLLLSLLYVSCKKSNPPSAVVNDEPACVQHRSAHDGDTVAGQYIIIYDTGTITKTMSGRDVGDVSERLLRKHRINTAAMLQSFAGEPGGFVAKLSPAEFAKLHKDDAVSNIEPDRVIALGTCFTVVAPWLITWNVNRVGYGDGTGKVAWVIDTGIDLNHPDLTTDATRSRSFISGQTSAADQNGHGTHVAGIIAAKNNHFGVLGVASGATLVSLRVLDEQGEGLLSNIILALSYVGANAKAGDVVNMSLGQEGISNILDQKVLSTASKGILISIAAGNDHKPARQFSPSRVNGQNIYTVSAIDSTGKFAAFSNYGNDAVDYAAPGVRILSTYLNNRYALMSGTSMAAPHVAGLLLLKGNNINVSGNASNDPDGIADAIAHY